MTPIDDLARNLALRSEARDIPFERMARAVAAPMSRRRAFQVAAAAGVTSFFTLRTDTAYGQGCPSCPQPRDPPGFTQFCGHTRGVGCLYVCCPENHQCCQTEKVVVCCPANNECGPIVNEGHTCRCKPQYDCGPDANTCCTTDEECFEPRGASNFDDLYCIPACPEGDYYQCLNENGQSTEHCCFGPSEECCGDGCCDDDGVCCSSGRTDWCCPHAYGCTGTAGVCGCREGQRCGDHCCELGTVCCTINTANQLNVSCCGVRDLDDLLDSIGNFFGAGAGAASGAGASAAAARLPQPAASPGSADALVAIGAVGDLAALAYDTIKNPRPDSAYRRAVKAPRVALRPVVSGPGLDAAAAQALTKMLIAEARAWALIYAVAVARARALGAIKGRNMKAARSQARASAAFAARAGKALRRVPGLRSAALAALQAGGTPEVSVTARAVRSFQNSVRSNGLPADLRARLAQLGLSPAERRRVAKLIVSRQRDARAANVLIEPLADASNQAALRKLAKKLARFAAATRRHPISVSKPGPGKVRAKRPHTSQASGSRKRGAS
jgi:hypothetical protein